MVLNNKVSKDDFVNGLVPHHNHGSVDYTSVEAGHVHQCLDVTSPPIPTNDQSHISSLTPKTAKTIGKSMFLAVF
jgi:hypothetical protein